MCKSAPNLNSNTLKMIAVIAMTVDHIAWLIFPGYSTDVLPIIMHSFGRLTCPIMCFFIAEGYYYTKNKNKYTARLFVFALISHFAYIFASNSYTDTKSFIPFYYGDVLNQTSVMWSLAWGLVMLRVFYSNKIKSDTLKVCLLFIICLLSFPSDWSCVAALCVLSFGINRGNFKKQATGLMLFVGCYAIVYAFSSNILYGILQMGVVFSLPLIYMYNGERGKSPAFNKFTKWFFYIYYPLHLLIIGLIKYFP